MKEIVSALLYPDMIGIPGRDRDKYLPAIIRKIAITFVAFVKGHYKNMVQLSTSHFQSNAKIVKYKH